MKRYIVDVLIGLHSAKKFVVDSLDVAEMMAEHFRDDVTDVVIREVKV
jgi:hypothetical protein